MVDNFNSAMEAVAAEYVCFIGDDDGINPELLDAAQWARLKISMRSGVRQLPTTFGQIFTQI